MPDAVVVCCAFTTVEMDPKIHFASDKNPKIPSACDLVIRVPNTPHLVIKP